MKKLISTLLIIFAASSLTACSSNERNNTVVDYTKVSRDVSSYDTDALYNKALALISGEETTEMIKLNSEDIINNPTVNNYYYFNGSVYIQIDNYMYRFQLENNEIVSYIKYTLEA